MADNSICKIDGCGKATVARGWCRAHYTKWNRYGNPLALRKSGQCQRYIENVVIPHSSNECLPWPFAVNRKGYGTFGNSLAHRYVCALVHGAPPTSKHEAAHYCGNRICVNAHHIRWATHTENIADTFIHGTHNRGERSASARLTADDVRQIRAIYATTPNREIALRFGISTGHVAQIANRKKWAHLD